jgi:hypothetical protein
VADEVVERDAFNGQIVVGAGQSGTEAGSERRLGCLRAFLGDVAVKVHGGEQGVLDGIARDPVACHHGAEDKRRFVQVGVAGELASDPLQGGKSVRTFARCWRLAACPVPACPLRRIHQSDNGGRHDRDRLGGECQRQVGLAGDRDITPAVGELCARGDDKAAGTANVDSGWQSPAAVGQDCRRLGEVDMDAIARRAHDRHCRK